MRQCTQKREPHAVRQILYREREILESNKIQIKPQCIENVVTYFVD